MQNDNKRIEWIDLAKGMCILMVVWQHINNGFGIRFGVTELSIIDRTGFYFRMPLYFFLSGLFFKTYGNFLSFSIKKINKLFIPFFTFFFVSLIWCTLMKWHFSSSYDFIGNWFNLVPFSPIWFLICLFQLNILCFFLNEKVKKQALCLPLSLLIGCVGYWIGIIKVGTMFEEPLQYLHTDATLTAMPFFIAGSIIRQKSNFLSSKANAIDAIIIAGGFSLIYFLQKIVGCEILFAVNSFNVNIIIVYIGGFAGLMAVLSLAKFFKKIIGISYLGRYSIIVLIMHGFYATIIPYSKQEMFAKQFGSFAPFIAFAVIILICFPTILFCKKYLPYVFAQKDLIEFK